MLYYLGGWSWPECQPPACQQLLLPKCLSCCQQPLAYLASHLPIDSLVASYLPIASHIATSHHIASHITCSPAATIASSLLPLVPVTYFVAYCLSAQMSGATCFVASLPTTCLSRCPPPSDGKCQSRPLQCFNIIAPESDVRVRPNWNLKPCLASSNLLVDKFQLLFLWGGELSPPV